MENNAEMVVPDLQYKILPLEKVEIRGMDEKKPLKCELRVGGKWHATTERFWTSFFAKFGFSESIFRYYAHQEVFDRICTVKPDTELRFCVEQNDCRALAVSNPKRPIIHPENFLKLAKKYSGQDIRYSKGVFTSVYTPPSGERKFKIGPDDFYNRYVLETPVDGYGKPSIFLSLLRQVCLNGAVAYSPAFRSDITVGDDPDYNIARSLESFDSDEGYSAVRSRFEASQLAPASLSECLKLFRMFTRMGDKKLLTSYEKVVGDIYDLYGVANLDGLSEKKLRLLPAKCKVYDLINLASEVSTHHVKSDDSRILQGWLGTVISEEFDLEGTSNKRTDFQALFIPNKPEKSGRRNRSN